LQLSAISVPGKLRVDICVRCDLPQHVGSTPRLTAAPGPHGSGLFLAAADEKFVCRSCVLRVCVVVQAEANSGVTNATLKALQGQWRATNAKGESIQVSFRAFNLRQSER
jgi:hypothetical protein